MADLISTDSALLEASSNDDRDAFAVLIDRHSPSLTRYAWALMSSRSDVQDVVQETWVTAWKKRSSIRVVEASMLPWLLVVCRNHSLNTRRRNTRYVTGPVPAEVSADMQADEAKAQLRWVLEEIAELGETDRRLCELCLIDGFSYDEAAMVVGTTPGAARKRIERVRTRLRNAVLHSD